MNDELIFTPSAVLGLLTEIEELKGKQITFKESPEGIVLTIDDSQYVIDPEAAVSVEVDKDDYDAVSDVNEGGYSDLEDTSNVSFEDDDEAVEGGIIKELVKTLAIGGLVRLTTNALKKS